MNTIADLIEALTTAPHSEAYECLKQLEEISRVSGEVYPYFDEFAGLLDSASSYRRIRGIRLIAANAHWDTERKISALLDKLLGCLHDPKPSVTRLCIQALPAVAKAQPELRSFISTALLGMDPWIYPDSMAPLIEKDRHAALRQLESKTP